MKIEAITNIETKFVILDELNDFQVLEFSHFLYEGVGLNKNSIGDFLGENKAFSKRVNTAFFSHFPF